MILRAEKISKSYRTGNGLLEVLKDLDITISESEIVSVVGPSGCGKSTLLNVLGTLDRSDSGQIWIDGQNILDLGDKSLSRLRNKTIGFVFQFHHLLPEFTVMENLLIPQLINGVSREKAQERVLHLLELVNLIDRKDHKPAAISGGERQRVAVLRALINKPKLILADEPTGNLDVKTGQKLLDLIEQMRNQFGSAFLIATHNQDIAAYCDRNLELVDKKLIEIG